MKVVSYLRVSGGEGGLSYDLQREYIIRAAEQNGWEIVAEFSEFERSKVAIEKRDKGAKALAMCKELNAQLVVAKLDRLTRSPSHIARLIGELGIGFKVATMPHATSFQLHLYSELVEQERKFISQCAKEPRPPVTQITFISDTAALFAVRPWDNVVTLDQENRQLAAAAVSKRVKAFHSEILPHVQSCLQTGLTTLTEVADCLNGKGIKTSRGGVWSGTQVRRVMEALNLKL